LPAVLERVMHQAYRCNSSILDASARKEPRALETVLEVEVEGHTITLPAAISNEEAIARVEQHLRGKRCAAVPTRAHSPLINQSIL
jgi:hypothetical protein